MPATTAHQPIRAEQQIVEDAAGYQDAVVELQVDIEWLLARLLDVVDHDPALRDELRTAISNGNDLRRGFALSQICADARVITATTMVQTCAETDRLRQILDEESMEPDRCRTGCGRLATDPSGYCDADLDGRVA